MLTGRLQHRFFNEAPAIFDKDTRTVTLNINPAIQTNSDTNEEEEGYTAAQMQIDAQMGYAHIKSQLIEAAYAPKEEFALIINALEALFDKLYASEALSEEDMQHPDIVKFKHFKEYRALCAAAAHEVMSHF